MERVDLSEILKLEGTHTLELRTGWLMHQLIFDTGKNNLSISLPEQGLKIAYDWDLLEQNPESYAQEQLLAHEGYAKFLDGTIALRIEEYNRNLGIQMDNRVYREQESKVHKKVFMPFLKARAYFRDHKSLKKDLTEQIELRKMYAYHADALRHFFSEGMEFFALHHDLLTGLSDTGKEKLKNAMRAAEGISSLYGKLRNTLQNEIEIIREELRYYYP